MTGETIHILLCEDQTLMRQGLHTVLELEPGFEVVAEAADGEEAIQRYNELQKQGHAPDIILMGYSDAAQKRCPGNGSHY